MATNADFERTRGAIEAQAKRSVEAFAEAADRLRIAHADLAALGRRLDDLSGLLAAQEIDSDPISPVAAAARALGAALAGGEDRAAAEADLAQASASLGQIEREVRELGAIASITMVTAGSLGAAGLDAYVADLRRLIATLAQESAALAGSIGGVGAALRASDRAGAKASRALRAAAASIDSGRARREATRAEAARLLRRLSATAGSYAEAVARETSAVVAAMQFSDSLAQRIDHAQQILAAAGGRESEVRALAAAQVDALAADARARAADADRSMARLAAEGGRVCAVFGAPGEDGAAGAALRSRKTDLQAIASRRAEAVAAAGIAADAGGRVRALLADAMQRFGGLIRSSAGINLSAINAMLLTARSGASRAALGVLSDAVRECALECAARGVECNEALRRLSDAAAAGRGSEIADAAAAFAGALSGAEDRLGAAERALAALDGMRRDTAESSARLPAATRGARQALGEVAAAAADLAALARGLRGERAAPPDAERLADLFDLYTMEREREIHLALVGGTAPRRIEAPPPPAAAAAEASLEDILF